MKDTFSAPASQQHDIAAITHDNASNNVQQMQAIQVVQDYQAPPPNNLSQPVVMNKFFYKPYNDFQIYHITCKEISIEIVLQLLNNHVHHGRLNQSHVQSSNSHVFYYQHPDDKKIYQIICEVVSYTFIVRLLNEISYGIELTQQQENLEFSKEFKENLEFHLKHDLIYYLAPIGNNEMNFGQDNFDNGMGGSDTILVDTAQQDIQSFISQQDNSDQFITSQNSVEDYTQDHNNTNI